MAKEKEKSRHKGNYVGAYLSEEHLAKIEEVASKYDELFGEKGRNRSRAISYIIDCFNPAVLTDFPKSQPRAGMSA